MGKAFVVVGSESALKLRAVKAAVEKLGLIHAAVAGCNASSGVAKQPFGFPEIITGARNRASAALGRYPDADFVVGIESGIVSLGGAYFDLIGISAGEVSGGHLRLFDNYSASLPIPKWIVKRVRDEDSELGVIMQELADGGEKDAQWLSRGAFRREDQMTQAIIGAFAPFRNADRYAEPNK